MKTQKVILTALIIGSTATLLLAQGQPSNRPQRPNGPPQGQQQGNRPGGPGGQSNQQGQQPGGQPGQSGQRPPFPLVDALDANRDSVIDATEMANAVASLKRLDKNSDGRLTPEEYLPQRFGQSRPGQSGGPAAGPGAQGGGGAPASGGTPPPPRQ